MPVVFHPRAAVELAEAVEWYESRSDGLGGALLEVVERALTAICDQPATWPLWPVLGEELQIRRFLLSRFPFAIAYRIRQEVVEIIAFAHLKLGRAIGGNDDCEQHLKSCEKARGADKQIVMRSQNMKTISWVAGLLAFTTIIGCGNGGHGPQANEPPIDLDSAIEQDRPEPGAQEVAKKPKHSSPKEKLEPIYDFVANLSQAHVRSGGLLIDFGTPSRHKHTLGDWKTGWRGDYDVDGDTFSYIASSPARVFFDALPEEVDATGGRITIRAKATGDATGKGRVFLNGKQVGTAEFPNDEFAHATVDYSRELVDGQNELMLRFDRKRPGHDGRAAALAVDYVRVVPNGAETGSAASTYTALRGADPAGGEDHLVLRSGESLTYHLAIPAGAVLLGRTRAAGVGARGKLEVRVRADGEPEQDLPSFAAGAEGGPLRVDLSDFAGRAAAITFGAQGDLLISRCRIAAEPAEPSGASGRVEAENLVIVLIDTLRADHLKLYNRATRVQTDYLDRLGAEAMTFERAWAQENWTKPSVATLLSGLYPETHRTKNDKHKLPSSVVLASEHFRALGFATAGFVANGYISHKFGFREGWDVWRNYVREGKANRAKFVTDDAVAWLDRRPRDKPFFLYVHTIDPHVPYIPPRKYTELYDPEPYKGVVQARSTAKLLERVKTGAARLSDRDKRHLEALYDGEITYHDDEIARLHEALDKHGLLEDTLIVVTSDHGEEFFEHGSVGHGHSVYEELLHVPLVFRLPGAEAGQAARCDAEVGLIDVLPTACEILGVECPPGMEGRSLVPLLEGACRDRWPQVTFADFLDGQRSARSGRFKLIYRGLAKTLFDLDADPDETRDLSDDLPIALAAMRDLLGQHQGRLSTDVGSPGAKGSGKKSKKKEHKAEETDIDEETRKQLEALGYFEE
jgi:arylsulfatase A-like enzyme